MTKFKRPRGTKDYLPEECKEREKIINAARKTFELYGYGEILTPSFETLELLEKKAGPEVKDQIYWFEDKAGRKLGLRFDITTSVARVVASNPNLTKPIKFYYIGPVWRYEEPQKGRLREFWHAGVELIGSNLLDADAEVIALTYKFFKEIGLESIKIRINSRKIVDFMVSKFSIESKKREDFYRAIDKLYKQGPQVVKELLIDIGLSEKDSEEILYFISLRDIEDMEEFLRKEENKEIIKELRRIKKLREILTEAYKISSENIIIDPSIVRGIGYYTGIVFEFMLDELTIGSLAAGGRYDNLISLFGGESISATGMSIGIERTIEAIKLMRKQIISNYILAKVLVIPIKRELSIKAAQITEYLRDHNIPAMLELMGRNLRSSLEYANKVKIPYVVIVGPKELSAGKVVLKEMQKRKEERVSIDLLSKYIK